MFITCTYDQTHKMPCFFNLIGVRWFVDPKFKMAAICKAWQQLNSSFVRYMYEVSRQHKQLECSKTIIKSIHATHYIMRVIVRIVYILCIFLIELWLFLNNCWKHGHWYDLFRCGSLRTPVPRDRGTSPLIHPTGINKKHLQKLIFD